MYTYDTPRVYESDTDGRGFLDEARREATRRWSYVCASSVEESGDASQNGTIRRESSGRLFHMQGPLVAPPSGRTIQTRDNYCNYRPKLCQRTRKASRGGR